MDVIKMTRPDLIRQTGIDRIPELIDPIKIGCLQFEKTLWADELKYLEELANEQTCSSNTI